MKKYLVSFALVVFFTMLFSACVMDVDKEDVIYGGIDFLIPRFRSINPPYIIIKSVLQMEEYIDLVKVDLFYFFSYTGGDDNEKFQKVWESDYEPRAASMRNKYNDAFFKHSNLVMISAGGGIKTEVKKIGTKNNELYVRINRTYCYGPQPDMAYPGIFLIIPIKKSSFNGDTVSIEIRDIYTLIPPLW